MMMFDGKVKSTRQISVAGRNAKTDPKTAKDLVEVARKQREARALDRQRNLAATKVQRLIRSKYTRIKLYSALRYEVDRGYGGVRSGTTTDGFANLLRTLTFVHTVGVDTERLLAVNRLFSIPTLHNQLTLWAENILSGGSAADSALSSLGTVGRFLGLSVETATSLLTQPSAVTNSEEIVTELLGTLRLFDLSQSSDRAQRVLGGVISVNATWAAADCLQRMSQRTGPRIGAIRLLVELKKAASVLLVQGLNLVKDSTFAELPDGVRNGVLGLRKRAVRLVAAKLLSQGHDGWAREGWASWVAAEDWLDILYRWRHEVAPGTLSPARAPASPVPGTPMALPTSPVTGTAAPSAARQTDAVRLARSVELLNILACFADSFVSQPQNQQLLFQQIPVPGIESSIQATYRELGGLFLSLASYLLGAQQAERRSSTQSSAEATASTAAVASLFGFTTAPVVNKGPTSSTDSAVPMDGLPVQWLVQNLVSSHAAAPRTPTAGAEEEDGRMDVVTSSAYVTMGEGEGQAGQLEPVPPVPEDLYVDYVQAAGWKKLEYRVAGLCRSIAALQDRAIAEASGKSGQAPGGQQLRQKLLGGRSSLEGLVASLTTKELITALTGAIGPDHAPGGPSTDAAVRAVELYTQLLLAFPTEMGGARGGHSRNAVLTADGKASLLITLAFVHPAAPLSRRLWLFIQQRYTAQVEAMLTYDDASLLSTKAFAEGALPAEVAYQQLLSALYLFCAVFLQQLAAVDDETLLEQDKIFTVPELCGMVVFLKRWLYKLYWSDPLFNIHSSFYHVPASGCTGLRLLKLHCQLSATRLFNHLCCRNERRPFLSPEDWGWGQMSGFDLAVRDDVTAAAATEAMYGSTLILKNARVKSVLTFIPQVVPFKQRVSVFHTHLDYDKTQYYATQEHGGAARLGLSGALRIEVHRDAIVADAYEQLREVGHRLKGMIKVEFISEQGLNEAGIDGGGLFKEFMDSFAKEAFSPTYGLFIPTSHQLLTPNPSSGQLGSNHLRYFHFVGKMLGKAVYERILMESEFAGGLLNFLLDRKNAIDDLYHLDEQLYRSLMQLKHHANSGGDLDSLELFFEVSRSEYGKAVTQELIPGGSSVRVTRANVHSYIHKLAHYKLNVETADQCRALRAGFQSMIPLEWIRMFNTRELQLLISGDRRSIDLADMMAHVTYGSGYHPSQPYIQAFWDIVAQMGPEDQSNLLKFVTSCSRQPLLGFSQLQPPFCIQKIPAYASQYTGLEPPQPGEVPRLPSAATCMNLLKLPMYDSVETLRERLLYAIRSNSGFELS